MISNLLYLAKQSGNLKTGTIEDKNNISNLAIMSKTFNELKGAENFILIYPYIYMGKEKCKMLYANTIYL